ncbi:MAG: thioredoxin family protein [Candidatus Thermoplasmatota archaeon]|nr:thioredoxin family protein [Candidatus Thermoplasmatota archaeon]
MKIEILGTGCPKCRSTEKIVRQVVEELGITADIQKIEELGDIIDRGVMLTPAIAIDGEVKLVGRVPRPDELKKLFEETR